MTPCREAASVGDMRRCKEHNCLRLYYAKDVCNYHYQKLPHILDKRKQNRQVQASFLSAITTKWQKDNRERYNKRQLSYYHNNKDQ